jgi:hypothetical protein
MHKENSTLEDYLLKRYFNKLPSQVYVNYFNKKANDKQWYLSLFFDSSEFPIDGIFTMTVSDEEKVTFKLSTDEKLNKKILSKVFSFFKIENIELLIKETLSKQKNRPKNILGPFPIIFDIEHNEEDYKLLRKLSFNNFIQYYSIIKDDIIISENFCNEVYDIFGDFFIKSKIIPIEFYEKLAFENFVSNNENQRCIDEKECLEYLKLNFGI